jgi:hypothetical protein
MTVLVLVETVVLAVLTVLVAGLLRAYATVLRRLHELDGGGTPSGPAAFSLPVLDTVSAPTAVLPTAVLPTARPAPAPGPGSHDAFGPAHDVAGETATGEIVSARVVGVEHRTLLLFLSSGCSSCEVFWEELARPVPLPSGTRLLVVPQGPAEDSPAALAELSPPGVDVVLSSQAWLDYEVPGSPHVVYADGATGRVLGEGTGQSLRQVAELLARSTGDAGFLTGARAAKPARDAQQEAAVDRELLAAGILPGDPRLYEAAEAGEGAP